MAEMHAQHGTCGTNVEWDISNDTIYVHGDGAMKNFQSSTDRPSWEIYREKIRHLVVEGNVTQIGNYAFSGYSLVSASIGEGTIRIGNHSFSGCSLLQEVKLPESLEIIGDNYTNYSDYGYAFSNCTAITEITIPKNVRSIGAGCFYKCMISKVYWNASNCAVDLFWTYYPSATHYRVFEGCPIQEVHFGEDVISIPQIAFSGNKELETVTTKGTVEYVGSSAFAGTKWINDNLVEEGLFYIDHAVYCFHMDNQLTEPISVNVKEGTTSITNFAFKDNNRLVEISLPESLKQIGNDAFQNCISLGKVYYNCRTMEDFSRSPFSTSLYSIEFGNNVEYLPAYLLAKCSGINALRLPESLRSIGSNAFEECKGISELSIPDKVETIGKQAVYRLDNLEVLTIGESLKNIDYYYLFAGCPKLKTIYWNAISLNPKGFDPYHTSDRCQAPVENLYFGDKVEYIPGNMFWECSTLKNVKLGSSVKIIGEAAFRGCGSLTEISFPESLETFEDYAFYHSGIKDVIIPKNVKSLGTWGLGTPSLKRVIMLPETAPNQGSCFMDHCNDLIVYVPNETNYKAKWGSYNSYIRPMIKTERDTFEYCGQVPDIDFESNIPDYEISEITCETLKANAGEHEVKAMVTFAGEHDFTTGLVFYYTILKGQQTISWEQDFDDVHVGDKIELSASASSGLDITYYRSTKNMEIVQEDGKTYLVCNMMGAAEIKAVQDGDDNWKPADPIIKEFNIKEKGTGVQNTAADGISVYSNNNREIIIDGINKPCSVKVYSADGKAVVDANICTGNVFLVNTSGIYFVKIGTKVYKIFVQ